MTHSATSRPLGPTGPVEAGAVSFMSEVPLTDIPRKRASVRVGPGGDGRGPVHAAALYPTESRHLSPTGSASWTTRPTGRDPSKET